MRRRDTSHVHFILTAPLLGSDAVVPARYQGGKS